MVTRNQNNNENHLISMKQLSISREKHFHLPMKSKQQPQKFYLIMRNACKEFLYVHHSHLTIFFVDHHFINFACMNDIDTQTQPPTHQNNLLKEIFLIISNAIEFLNYCYFFCTPTVCVCIHNKITITITNLIVYFLILIYTAFKEIGNKTQESSI